MAENGRGSGKDGEYETYSLIPLIAEPFSELQLSQIDRALQDSFLVRKKLIWEWTTTICRFNIGRFHLRRISLSSRKTNEPIGPIFTPLSGKMEAEVKVSYDEDEGNTLSIPLPRSLHIVRSANFRIMRLFWGTDLLTTILAFLLATVTGLSVYAFQANYGQFKDYLALFVWAAGIDQGKNLLSVLASNLSKKGYAAQAQPS